MCCVVLGGGIDVMTIGVRTYIRSVPGEFNLDKNKVMELAQQQGYISTGVWTHGCGMGTAKAQQHGCCCVYGMGGGVLRTQRAHSSRAASAHVFVELCVLMGVWQAERVVPCIQF
jgi:hypothetical protein